MDKSASMMTPAELAAYSRRSTFAGRAPLLGSGEPSLPAVTPAQPAPRRIGLIERLIAGPQGDPTLGEDFREFVLCTLAGCGLAALLVGIVLFLRAVSP